MCNQIILTKCVICQEFCMWLRQLNEPFVPFIAHTFQNMNLVTNWNFTWISWRKIWNQQIYLLFWTGALCENCIPEWIFSVCFWLGYFNSCLNPVIYACTSREFQRAFRRILCRNSPPRPHISRAIYRANNARFIERDYNGGVHLVGVGSPTGIPMIPVNQWR